MTTGIAGRVALITGASSGIGLAAARALVADGGSVMLAARSEDRLAAAAAELGEHAAAHAMDVGERASIDGLVQSTLDRFGRIDIVLANAGTYMQGELLQSDPERISQLVRTNVEGVIHTVQASLPHLIDSGMGDIVVTSSIAGHQSIHTEPVYSASKHAVQSFVHGVRQQLRGTGVRIGAVAPGTVLNELWEITSEEEVAAGVAEGMGMRSEDVADAIVFMLTRPRHVTIRDLVMLPRELPI